MKKMIEKESNCDVHAHGKTIQNSTQVLYYLNIILMCDYLFVYFSKINNKTFSRDFDQFYGKRGESLVQRTLTVFLV